MPNFTGQLKSNEIMSALYNMIISQQVFADNIAGTFSSLADMSRVDGSLHGDTKLYYSTDVLGSVEWGADAEASNLLELHRPAAPKQQAITLDIFRQIPLTVDYYLSKRAWKDEGSFSEFTSVLLGWLRNTKRVYDATTFNSYLGTAESKVGKQAIVVSLPKLTDPEAQARLRGQTISKALADLVIELKDVSRDYNDFEQLRSFDISNLVCVWNAKAINEIEHIDLPTIFHKDDLLKLIGQDVLPSKYFGKVNASGSTTASENKTVRSLIEKDYNEVKQDNPSYEPKKHIFPGDLLPNSTAYGPNETYTVDESILFKVMDKRSIPFMSAFEVGTSFFNPKSLTENHYLTWGHNKLEYLMNFPFITVRGNEAAPAKAAKI